MDPKTDDLLGTNTPLKDKHYLLLTLLADEKGNVQWGSYTEWVGFKNLKPLIERRIPSPIKPERMIELWTSLGLPYTVVSEENDLILFLMKGGHGLVEQGLARKAFPFLFEDDEGSRPYGFVGFVSAQGMPEAASNRAPSPRLRMAIFKRDSYRCRICGRRPEDHGDIELHVHHIRPWSGGGVTLDDNLITLCSTCHRGLDPHFEHGLFTLLDIGSTTAEKYAADHLNGLRRYRELSKVFYEREPQEENGP